MGRPRRHHVVPKAYLARWTRDGRLTAHDVRDQRTFLAGPRDVGVIVNFYRRIGAGGEPDDDVERHISYGETVGLPILKAVPRRWPPTPDTKGHLAALLAVQVVRGVRWRTAHDRALRRTGQTLRSQLRAQFEGNGWRLPDGARITAELYDAEFDRSMERMRGNNERLVQMLHPVENIASLLASMHWSHLQFGSPVLVTSDEPVVLWPRSELTSVPRAWPQTAGLLQSLEFRFPLSPTEALILTWLDEPDEAFADAPTSIARNLNAFTVAHASRQWVSVPEEPLELPAGRPALAPVSSMLHPGYGPAAAETSIRRRETDRDVNSRLGADPVGQVRVTSVTRRTPGRSRA